VPPTWRRGEAARRSSAATERFPPHADPQVRPPTQTPGYSRALRFAKCMSPARVSRFPTLARGKRRASVTPGSEINPAARVVNTSRAGSRLAGRAEPLTSDPPPHVLDGRSGRRTPVGSASQMRNAQRTVGGRFRLHRSSREQAATSADFSLLSARCASRPGRRRRLSRTLTCEPEDQLCGFDRHIELRTVADPVEQHPVGVG
jgi:hypothetical protein